MSGAVLKGLRWKVWIAASASAALCIYAALLLYEGFVAAPYEGVFTLPFVDKPSAQRAYEALTANADARGRRAAAWRLVRGDPADAAGWIAVAYADWLQHGRLGPEGLAALDHSYAVSFFDARQAVWRVGFALENWPTLTPQIRQDVLTEAQTALQDRRLGPQMKARLATVRNPQGRLAALLLSPDARP
ncbi:MAG: hypothetical protein JO127_00030 [Caulobacteraceae bacterium]|nr:hypothetical protein [Caulobacteraceae bacterium]